MDISAKQVMELRQATGMPMMQCKKALITNDGDYEKAVETLRSLGMKTAEKRSGRATSEGLLAVRISADGKTGSMLQVLCETEPVKKTPKFVQFLEEAANLAAKLDIGDRETLLAQAWEGEGEGTVESVLRDLVGLIGENMQLGRLARFVVEGDGIVGAYVHNDQKQGALVALAGATQALAETAKEVCQHIVFARPSVLDRDQVPAEEVEKETAFLRQQLRDDPKMASKPEQALAGILEGRLNKNFFATRALNEQGWYRDPSKKVSAVLSERGVCVQEFALFNPGA